MIDDLRHIRALAARQRWREIAWQPTIWMVSFARAGVRVNVYLTRMTVSTSLWHPRQGNTQMYRRHITLDQLEKILENPRVHGLGAYERRRDVT